MILYVLLYLFLAGFVSAGYLSMWEDDLTLRKWVGTTVLFPVLVVKGVWFLAKCWWWLVNNLFDCIGLAWKTIW